MPHLTYALNENGELVGVDSVPTGANCNCFCPGCRGRLLAKNKGEKRSHHFAHRGIECQSAYESMLHLLAKEKIKKAFLSSSEFWIKFNYRSFCLNKKECKYITYDKCYEDIPRSYNLKKYYDSCEQEIMYDNSRRRSDLKIFSSQNHNRAPIYLEFCVTHTSDNEKLHSGNRIIEIKIESEDDILSISKNGLIESDEHSYSKSDNIDKRDCKLMFYGFKKEDFTNNTIENEVEFIRYILYNSGKVFSINDSCLCKSLKKTYNNSLLEMCEHTQLSLVGIDNFALIGYKKFEIKNCRLCKNYVSSYNTDEGKICRLYKRIQIPRKNLDTARAKLCRHFELIEKIDDPNFEQLLKDTCTILE